MDSFELNKIMGAVLGTLLFVMGVGFLAEAIYHPIEGRGPGYALPEPEVVAGGEPAEAAPEIPLGVLLASASVDRGIAAARKCQSCHNFGEGEPNKQGPYLWGTIGAPKAHAEGFAYSDILLEQRAEGQIWSYENLNAFLTNPRGYAPGTKMTFAGIRSPEERADILAYFQTLTNDPLPFPPAEATAEEPAVAPETTLAPEGTEPTSPDAVTDTPTTTSTETQVQGTPTGSGTPAGQDLAPVTPEVAPAPPAPETDAITTPAETTEPTAPATNGSAPTTTTPPAAPAPTSGSTPATPAAPVQ